MLLWAQPSSRPPVCSVPLLAYQGLWGLLCPLQKMSSLLAPEGTFFSPCTQTCPFASAVHSLHAKWETPLRDCQPPQVTLGSRGCVAMFQRTSHLLCLFFLLPHWSFGPKGTIRTSPQASLSLQLHFWPELPGDPSPTFPHCPSQFKEAIKGNQGKEKDGQDGGNTFGLISKVFFCYLSYYFIFILCFPIEPKAKGQCSPSSA